MESISAAVMLKALDGLSVRQTATAQNIANAGTPNYRPIRITFEDALKAAAADEKAISEVRAKVEPQSSLPLGPEMRLDLEIATAASTAGRYGAIVDLLGRHLQLEAIAISGGR